MRDPLLRQHIAELLPTWNVQDVRSFAYLEGGYSNHNYRFDYCGRRYVLRLPVAGSSESGFADRSLEAAFYAAARDNPALPEVIAYDARSGRMISRWHTGTLLGDALTAGEPTLTPAELVDYLADLRRAVPPSSRTYDPLQLARRDLRLGTPDPAIVTLAGHIRWSPPALVASHNDLNPWNVIRAGARSWVTLDWEWHGNNDPLFDLVTLHQGLALSDAELPALAERLLGQAPGDERLLRILQAFWLREYAWAHAALARGVDREEIVAQRDTALIMLRAARSW